MSCDNVNMYVLTGALEHVHEQLLGNFSILFTSSSYEFHQKGYKFHQSGYEFHQTDYEYN